MVFFSLEILLLQWIVFFKQTTFDLWFNRGGWSRILMFHVETWGNYDGNSNFVRPFPLSSIFFAFLRFLRPSRPASSLFSPLWRQFENTGVETVMRFSRSRGGVIIALGSTRAIVEQAFLLLLLLLLVFFLFLRRGIEINFKIEIIRLAIINFSKGSIFDVCIRLVFRFGMRFN